MTDKRSRNEDEYFVKRDAEILREQRAKAQSALADAERKSHFMKCPKDGYDLLTQEFHGIPIETCEHCHGIWLDAGELDLVTKHHEPGFFDRVFGDVMSSLRRAPRGAPGAPSRVSGKPVG